MSELSAEQRAFNDGLVTGWTQALVSVRTYLKRSQAAKVPLSDALRELDTLQDRMVEPDPPGWRHAS